LAGFKTHIATSSLLGAGYAAGAAVWCDFPLPTCALAGCLCGVAGMMPDLDSDSGVPLRESMAFAAAVVPLLLVDRLERFSVAPESMVLAGALVYLFVRFGVTSVLKRYTVHRGMFHSLPAALIAGELAFLLCNFGDLVLRFYLAGGVVMGYVSHLLLDELYSLEWYRGRWRLKKSFGTALKLWSTKSTWANVSAYAKLALLTFVSVNDPNWMQQLGPKAQELQRLADTVTTQVLK